MTTMRWFRTGRSARGAPGFRDRLGSRGRSILLLALVGVLQTGCQSGFFGAGGANPCGGSPCGGGACGGGGPCKYLKGLRERVFNRSSNECCGPVVGGEAPLEMGSPAVVTPAPGVTLPSAPAELPPTELSPAAPIERAPSAAPGPPAGSGPQGSRSPTGKANYEAARPRYRFSRPGGENVARAITPTPEPTTRSAGGSVSSTFSLDNLPPLDIPKDESRNEMPAAASAVTTQGRSTGSATPPVRDDSVPISAPAQSDTTRSSPAAANGPAAAGTRSSIPVPAPADVSVAPGIRRFVALEPKLAGGSLPASTGLDWLAEKGYKTILDLREPSEVEASFVDEVSRRGLRYVMLPITALKLNSEHVSRFNLELSVADARPLYFCDNDGNRAGALWYIRRVTIEKLDSQAATREAEELGLGDKTYWQAASTYVESVSPRPVPAASPPPASNSPQPSNDASPAGPSPTTQVEPAPVPYNRPTDIAQIPYDTLAQIDPQDPTAWRSCAALMLTGLGVPLAYLGRSAFPTFRTLQKASLPGPGRGPRSLPPASDG